MVKTYSKPQQIFHFEDLPVYLTRKQVKRVSVRFKENRIDVGAPLKVSILELADLFNENRELFKKKLRKVQDRFDNYPIPRGDEKTLQKVSEVKSILLFGDKLNLVYKPEATSVYQEDSNLVLPENYRRLDLESFKNRIADFAEKELREYIQQRLDYWYKKTGLKCSSYQIRKMKTRWGSCTFGKSTMRFNFYLAFLPKSAIDSVVIHELCHLKEPNHQKEFYNLLLKYDPNYYEDNEILKRIQCPVDYLFSS